MAETQSQSRSPMELYRTWTGQSNRSQQTEQSKQVQHGSSRGPARDPLAGHLNHLTAPQEAALDKFKSVLHERGLWKPGTSASRPSHDDATLLRYLRARKFEVNGAVGQFSDTEHWLKEQRVEELYEHYDVEAYERARKMYPQWTGHRDRRGIPLYVYVIKHLDSKNVKAYQKDAENYKKSLPYHKGLDTPAQLIPLFALYHNLLNFVLPMCSTLERPNPEVPVTNSTNIVDVSGVGLAQFWNLKSHMQDASVLATAHYPETLDRIFIIGAPSFFPTVWGWIKRWFDPVTVSKIFILGKHEVKSTLSSYIRPDDYPKRYGGNLDWDFGMLPHMDDDSLTAVEKDGRKGWVDGPCLWLDHKRFAVGTVNGISRRPDSEIAALKPVVYAADKTDEPVHPNGAAKRSFERPVTILENHAVDTKEEYGLSAPANGEVKVTSHTAGPVHPSHPTASYKNVQDGAEMDTQAGNAEPEYTRIIPADPSHPMVSYQTVQDGAEMDTQANKAEPELTHAQSAERAKNINMHVPDTAAPSRAQEAPAAVGVGHGRKVSNQMNMHESLIQGITIKKMQDESISVIPSKANGSAHHAELLVASDPTKGLVLETEKLNMNGQVKPPMERFVTAVEHLPTVNGRA